MDVNYQRVVLFTVNTHENEYC